MVGRRSFLRGLVSVGLAAPAIVRAVSLMPIRGRRLVIDDETYWVNGFSDEDGAGTRANPWRTLQQAMDYINRGLDLNGHYVTVNLDGFVTGNVDLGRNVSLAVDECGFCDLSGVISFEGDRDVINVRNNSYLNLRDLTFNARDPIIERAIIRGDSVKTATVANVDLVDELQGWADAIGRSAEKVKR